MARLSLEPEIEKAVAKSAGAAYVNPSNAA
jgi:hypothetical protein